MSLLRDAGVAGAAALLYPQTAVGQAAQTSVSQSPEMQYVMRPSTELLAEHEQNQVQVVAGDMVVSFDQRYGTISSITRKGDALATNFLGNAQNTPEVDVSDSRFTGDVVTTTWELLQDYTKAGLGQSQVFQSSGRWRREITSQSGDIRRVSSGDNTFGVRYAGGSSGEKGIRSYNLTMKYRAEGGALLWDIEIENVTGKVLEIGELGLPLMVNDDYAELYIQPGTETKISGGGNVDFAKSSLRQKLIHEQKMLVHHFIAGHSSYALVQRPLGDAPYLLVHPTMDTSFECIYKETAAESQFAQHTRSWNGPDVMAIHSWATKNRRGWRKNPWVNGHTSLILQPGEKKRYQMRFVFVPSYEAIREELYKAGNLGVRILPSMVVQEETDVHVELQTKNDVAKMAFLSDNITLKSKKRDGEKTLLTFSFKGRGQKSVKLNYGEGRWTNLHFYCIEDMEGLLKGRGRFIVEREFYENPEDPYHRNHMFLPFDHRIGSTFLDADEVWEVGGSDESGFSEALFLAEKNVYYPSKQEVATLETYVQDCLFKYIQNPETYLVRASLYYKDRYPSSAWGAWTKERSEETFRSYNYVHPANIYHALYRIGKTYGLISKKTPQEYLRMSYETCLRWFTTGPWRHVGLMEGSNAIYILADIKREGWNAEYDKLLAEMKECNQQFVDDPYPYGSELLIDQTAHEQVFFFTRFFNSTEKNAKTMQVLKALRGGNQPVWFRYGNDKRSDVCCWYNESLNGLALLQAYEDTGDTDMLLKGYAGAMSVMANVLPDGMGYNQFQCTAGVYDWEAPRTFESGSGLWGFLRASKSYIVKDPSFGVVGYGCRVETNGAEVTAYPKDGVRKRVRFVEQKVDVETTAGEIERVSLREGGAIELSLKDSTGLARVAVVTVKGMPDGQYSVSHGRSSSRQESVKGVLTMSVPIAEAGHLVVKKA